MAAGHESSGAATGRSAGAAYHAALDATEAEAAAVVARMAAIAGPARRLVVTGGWATGAGAQAVKRRHLGPFEHLPVVSTGARGAALAGGRAAGLWPALDDVTGARARPGS